MKDDDKKKTARDFSKYGGGEMSNQTIRDVLEETIRRVMRWDLDASSLEHDIEHLKNTQSAQIKKIIEEEREKL